MNFFEKLADLLDPLGSLAKICGIAGLSFGVLFLVFKDILRKSIFSALTKQQSYKTIKLIIFCSFGLAFTGLIIYGFVQYHETNYSNLPSRKIDTVNYEPLRLEKKGFKITDSTKKKK